MNSRRKFIKEMLKALPPLKAQKFLNDLMLPDAHYNIMFYLYVKHLRQQTVADLLHCSLETLKRRHAEALDMIESSLDVI